MPQIPFRSQHVFINLLQARQRNERDKRGVDEAIVRARTYFEASKANAPVEMKNASQRESFKLTEIELMYIEGTMGDYPEGRRGVRTVAHSPHQHYNGSYIMWVVYVATSGSNR